MKPCGQGAGRRWRCLFLKKTWKGNREVFFFAVAQPLLFLAPWNRQVYYLQLLSSYKTQLAPTGPVLRTPGAKLRSKEQFSERWPRFSVERRYSHCEDDGARGFPLYVGENFSLLSSVHLGRTIVQIEISFLKQKQKNTHVSNHLFSCWEEPSSYHLREKVENSYHLREKVENALSDFLRFSSGSGLWHFP